jgi:hypothetical protein
MRDRNRSLFCIIPALAVLGAHAPAIQAVDGANIDPRTYLAELARLGVRKPFLIDSPDVYLEPRSLNRFFTEPIYRRLKGNAYFGYEYDEGFSLAGQAVQIEVLKDLTPGAIYVPVYRLALERALASSGFEVKPSVPCLIGVCIVGVEAQETERTLPGVMVEAYLRNASQKKSIFIRYGAGSPRGLAPAIRLSAEMLVSRLASKLRSDEHPGTR